MQVSRYDAIVVGGGHAGCEAAHALASMGSNTLLITQNIETIGQMSCNPAMGGLAKSQLIREVDAMGGLIAKMADLAAIQYRRLNRSKGPAVRATRCQCDMAIYRRVVQRALFETTNLCILQDQVEGLYLDGGRVGGVTTALGESYRTDAVIVTTGTFLRGICHIGLHSFAGGRAGDASAVALADALESLGVEVGSLKTGTTPRLDGRTIDWSVTEPQPPEENPRRLSSFHNPPLLPQRSCYITGTNERTHEIIRDATDRSPLFTGIIKGTGPRYCPSIEDKVARFPDKNRHQIFLEPQGLDTPEIYPNGVSTSLPFDVQRDFIRSIDGLENAKITRAGYAVEYAFVQPTQLYPTLEMKSLPGLYLAGQINGTSGYEEAAAQGLMAGINASRALSGSGEIILGRDHAYIGVLIDDLVTKGTDEPYRMFTSRAEFRLSLREDNADVRLCELGHEIGLLSESDYSRFQDKKQQMRRLSATLDGCRVKPSVANNEISTRLGLGGISQTATLLALLSRPGSRLSTLKELASTPLELEGVEDDAIEAVEIQARYAGYARRQRDQAERFRTLENKKIPIDIDYDNVAGLSWEASEKLKKIRPLTLGQAGRISGITPAAITAIMIHKGS